MITRSVFTVTLQHQPWPFVQIRPPVGLTADGGAGGHHPTGPTAILGAALVVTVRLVALWRKWNAPVARGLES
jgi:hypothetical protein